MSPMITFQKIPGNGVVKNAHAAKSCVLVGLGKRTISKTLPALLKLAQHGRVQITGTVDPEVTSAPIDTLPLFPNVDEFLAADEAAQVAYVAVPHNEYTTILPLLIKAGVDVLKEKPLACNGTQALELKKLAETHSARIGVLCQRRFSKRYSMLKQWLPRLGKISSVHAVETMDVHRLDEGWRAHKRLAGGGVVLDMGYHMLDQLMGIFGQNFSVQHAKLSKTRQGDYDIDDTAQVIVRFERDVTATLFFSRSGSMCEEKITIIGEAGVLVLDGDHVRLSLRDDSGTFEHEEYVAKETSSQLVEQGFRSFLSELTTDEWSLDRDVAVMMLIDEIYCAGNKEFQLTAGQVPLKKPWSWPRITPDVEEALNKQFQDTLSIYNNGGIIGHFENSFKQFHNAPNSHALLHNSGTNSLHALYYGAGLGSDDEVIVPVYTFHATVSPLMQLGVKIVFVDADAKTGNLDPESLREAITPKTKAVVVTHMWGVPCPMKEIVDICSTAGILLFEDCSHSHGASIDGQTVGTFGDGAAWSIQGDKVLSGGEGGISLTIHAEIFYRQLLHGHYNKRCKEEIPTGHWLREFEITGTGLKNRAHPLAITIAHTQLEKLPALLECKAKYAAHFIKTLASIPFLHAPVIDARVCPAWYALIFRFDSSKAPDGVTRERYVEEVKSRGVNFIDIPNSTRPLYDEPLYRRPWEVLPHVYTRNAYAATWKASDFPGAVAFHSSVIKLPVWAYEDDWETVQACARVMLEVANAFLEIKIYQEED